MPPGEAHRIMRRPETLVPLVTAWMLANAAIILAEPGGVDAAIKAVNDSPRAMLLLQLLLLGACFAFQVVLRHAGRKLGMQKFMTELVCIALPAVLLFLFAIWFGRLMSV